MSELHDLGGRILELLDTKSKVTIRDLKLCHQAVHDRCEHLRCPVFNKAMPSEAWYRKYIESQHNMFLIDTDVGLAASTQGAVIKKKIPKKRTRQRKDKYLFFIYLSPKLQDPLQRLFTIAHEIAHVLLHGRILHPGMHIARRSSDWHQYRQRWAQLMEVEANLFALYSLIPDDLICAIDDQLAGDFPNATRTVIIQQVLSNLYGYRLCYGMVQERLFVRSRNFDFNAYKSLAIDSYPYSTSSWMLNGYRESTKHYESARYRRIDQKCKGLSQSISKMILRKNKFSPRFSFHQIKES